MRTQPRRHLLSSRRALVVILCIVLAFVFFVLFRNFHNFATSTAEESLTTSRRDEPHFVQRHRHHRRNSKDTSNKKSSPWKPRSEQKQQHDEGGDEIVAEADTILDLRDAAERAVNGALSRVPISRKDAHVQWIPRVNGALYASTSADDDLLHEREAAGEGGKQQEQQQHCQIEFDVLPENINHNLNKKKGSKVSAAEMSGKAASILNFTLARETTLRFCAAKAAQPLLAETAKLGVTAALMEDLGAEFTDRRDEHIDLVENHLPFRSSQPHYHAYQLLLAELFAASVDFVFDFETDSADFGAHAQTHRRRHYCDVSLFPLHPDAVFGGGGGGGGASDTQEGKAASTLFEDETYSLTIASTTNRKEGRNKNKKQQQQQQQKANAQKKNKNDDESRKGTPSNANIIIEANSVLGVNHALRSLFLHVKSSLRLRERIFQGADDVPPLLTLPCLRIVRDAPVLGYRSQHIDIARHFFAASMLKQEVLRPMAWGKMNVLHVHASDDQGWRVESALLPGLHQFGGRRGPSLNGKTGSKKFVNSHAYPGFSLRNKVAAEGDASKQEASWWTREEIFEFVHEARARGIRVIPEVDLPAHASALLLAIEAEVLRFAELKSSSKSSSSKSGATSEKSIEIQLKERLHQSLDNVFQGESLLQQSARETHLTQTLRSSIIPRAATALDRAVELLGDKEANLFGGEYSSVDAWRRSFFGTLINGNSDCLAGKHLERSAQILRQRELIAQQQSLREFMLSDWRNSSRFSEQLQQAAAAAEASGGKSTSSSPILSFVAAHSAVNCMGGSHAIFDPTPEAADVLLLVLADVSLAFHQPLLYAASSSSAAAATAAVDVPHGVFASDSFATEVLFHFGADQAEGLRNFAWSPWIQRAAAEEEKAVGESDPLVVKGDEEQDENAFAGAAAAAKKKRNKKKGVNSKKKKRLETDFHHTVCEQVETAFPHLVPGASYRAIENAQPALMNFLIEKMQEASGSWHLRGAVWDEALIDFDVPPPAGTIAVLWREDFISWQDVSAAVMHHSKSPRHRSSSADEKMEKKQQEQEEAPAEVDSMLPSPSDYVYPVVYGGKTHLYFDYQQHNGGKNGNDGHWPLNVFGPWIPAKAATLSRVFSSVDVWPPEFLDACSLPPLRHPQQSPTTSFFLSTLRTSSNPYSTKIPHLLLVGVQSGLWSELLVSEDKFLYQLFPRIMAVAEISWATCQAGVTPTVRVSRHDSALGIIPNQQQPKRRADRQHQDDLLLATETAPVAGEEGEFRWWAEQDRCLAEDLIDDHAAVALAAGGPGGGGKNWRDDKKQQQQQQNEQQGPAEAADIVSLESRCKKHDVTVPMMRSCIKWSKKRDPSHKGEGEETSANFELWQTRLLCSSQNH